MLFQRKEKRNSIDDDNEILYVHTHVRPTPTTQEEKKEATKRKKHRIELMQKLGLHPPIGSPYPTSRLKESMND